MVFVCVCVCVCVCVYTQWRAGIILSFDRQSGRHLVEYDDGQVEWLLLYHAEYRLIDVTTDEGHEIGYHAWLPPVLKAKTAARHAAGQDPKHSWAKLLTALEGKLADGAAAEDGNGSTQARQAVDRAAENLLAAGHGHPHHAMTLGLKGKGLVGHAVSVQWSDGKVSACFEDLLFSFSAAVDVVA